MNSTDISIFFIPYIIKQNQSRLLDKLYVVIEFYKWVLCKYAKIIFVFSPDSLL